MNRPFMPGGSGRRLIEKLRYEAYARQFGHLKDWTFMNYGYLDQAETPLVLAPEDELQRPFAALYERVARPVALAGRDVLEVGCGRGGGASFLARRLQPASYVGVDFVPDAVALCRQWHVVPGLRFQVGDAENLPFAAGSFDAVINVESSHGYPSMQRFLASVHRVLKPGGHLLMADFRPVARLPILEDQMLAAGFSIVERQDITPLVLASLSSNVMDRLRAMLAHVAPELLARFLEVGAFPGSGTYEAFHRGEFRYFRLALQKAA